jgi:hypothetical protein
VIGKALHPEYPGQERQRGNALIEAETKCLLWSAE